MELLKKVYGDRDKGDGEYAGKLDRDRVDKDEEYEVLYFIQKLMNKNKGSRHLYSLDLRQWELSTPDMWDEIYKLNEWSNDKNQKYDAVICSLSLQEKLVNNSHKAFINVESNFFKNIDQSCYCLASVGVLNIEEASCLMVGKENK